MNLGIIVADGPWRFFKDIYQDLESRYHVSVFDWHEVKAPFFYERINRNLFKHSLEKFLRMNDVVFFEWASETLAFATQLPKITSIVTRLHRYEMFEWSSEVNWANVDKIILVSQAMQRKFCEHFPDYSGKAVVIPEAVDTKRFLPVSKPFNGDLGTLCFITPRKRVYELVLTFAELNQKRDGLRLHIGGGGNKFPDYNDALNNLIKKLGLMDQVIFYGDITEPWNWYSNIDLFISNSYSEGLQVAPMEAMASGRFTLSHYWDGAEELLPVGNLFLTGAEMQEKILNYCDLNDAEKIRLQKKMRNIAVEKFDGELIKNQIRQVIEEVAHSRRQEILLPA